AYGGEGAGKTRTLAMWLLLRALEHAGSDGFIGATSPTNKRLKELRRALRERAPQAWGTWIESAKEYHFRFHVTIQCLSTVRRSSDEGSPIQGWSWRACGSDELQDQIHANEDIETRGRDALDGEYKRMCTATAKDSATWRAFRDSIVASPLWDIARLPGWTNPFVPRSWWEQLRHVLSPREYR